MKARESGMPGETVWNGFFDPPHVLDVMGVTPSCGSVAEFGCGYGTFTIPAAEIVSGTVHGLVVRK